MRYFEKYNSPNIDGNNKADGNASSDRKIVEKAFFKRDIIVYAVLVALIVSLFLIFVIPSNKNSNGFTVSRDGTTLVICSFNSDNHIEINQDFAELIEVSNIDNGYSVKIYKDSQKIGYNVIFFDISTKTAKVSESNCSERKDCFHAPSIKNNGTIYCSPHDLLIKPIGETASSPIVG